MFVPATGSNSDVANSFVDLAYADAYHDLRGNALWDGDEFARQAALVRATDFIEQVYGQRFIGTYSGIGLSWPRLNLSSYTATTIPDALKKATCELALEALAGNLNPVSGGDRAVIRERVEGAIDIEYADTVTKRMRPAVAGYLSCLLGGSAYNRPVVRV